MWKLQNLNRGTSTIVQILCLEMILSNFPLPVTDFVLWTRLLHGQPYVKPDVLYLILCTHSYWNSSWTRKIHCFSSVIRPLERLPGFIKTNPSISALTSYLLCQGCHCLLTQPPRVSWLFKVQSLDCNTKAQTDHVQSKLRSRKTSLLVLDAFPIMCSYLQVYCQISKSRQSTNLVMQ